MSSMGIGGQLPAVALGVLAGWSKQHLIMRMMQCLASIKVSRFQSVMQPESSATCRVRMVFMC